MYKLLTNPTSGVKSIGASTSCGAVDEPRAVRLTAAGAGVGVADDSMLCASLISSSPAAGPADTAPDRTASLSSPSPRMALISGASTTFALKSTRLSETEPARTEYTTRFEYEQSS